MPRGKVKWFSPEKGYGFILDSEGNDIFVHFSEVEGNGFRLLHEGEAVEYELTDTMKGLHARNVRRIGLNGDGQTANERDFSSSGS